MTNDTEGAKILFRVPEEDGSANVETLWAQPLGEDKYRLDNSPFYAYSVSRNDIILAPYDEAEGFPTFERVVEKSGHRTVRIVFGENTFEDSPHLQALKGLGCSFEGATKTYFAIDIPPEVSLEMVREYLVDADLQWEHADPSYSELYPNDV